MDIDWLRNEIDLIDKQVIHLLTRRMEAARKIGQIKRNEQKEVFDAKRERELLDKNAHLAGEEAWWVKIVYKTILQTSRKIQKEGM